MIVSNTLRCIFVAIPKTATHAIRFALRPYLDETRDWEQVGLFVQKKLPFAELARIDTGHIQAREARPILGEALWREYFKFAVVRNPYDRFVSFCAFVHREELTFAQNPRPWMKRTLADPATRNRVLFRPQHEFICDAQGEPLLDFVGRYERLEEEYARICARLGIPADRLPRVNRSRRGPFPDYYDEELRAAVFDFYRQDFTLFGYPEQG